MTTGSKHPFEKILLPRRDVASPGGLRYRVYRAPGDFVTVDAASAAEALKASGVDKALRIEREDIFLTNVLDLAALTVVQAAAAQAAAQAAAPKAEEAKAEPAAEAPAAPAADPNAALTSEQVDHLISGKPAA